MAWVVDSNLLLDVALNDRNFQIASTALLRKRRRRGLLVCPITIVEIAPSFAGDAAEVQNFLDGLGVDGAEAWTRQDTAAAAVAWARHVSRRRGQAVAKRPIGDVLIGAFAERFDGLLTRNAADFRALFPNLKIEAP